MSSSLSQRKNTKLPTPKSTYILPKVFCLILPAPEVFDVDGLAALALGVVVAGVPFGEVVGLLLVEPPVLVPVEAVPVRLGVEVITTPEPEPEAPL
jgi:hypothetical protein